MKRRNLILDLTSLLDVILIILFLVLTTSASQASAQVDELEQRASELEQQTTQLQTEVEQLQASQVPGTDSEKNWYQVYQEQVGRMEVYFPDDLRNEAMRLILPNGEERKKPETDDVSDWLTEAVDSIDSPVVIITFSYRNDAIYWRDYTGLRDLLLRLSTTSDKTIFYEEVPRK